MDNNIVRTPLLETVDLQKYFKIGKNSYLHAVDGINLKLHAGEIVESGTVEDIFMGDKHHPYTIGLFDSIPNLSSRANRLKPIPGLMPDPTNLPVGCAFAPRCKYATEACKQAQPVARHISDTHTVYCTAYDDPAFLIERSKNRE